MGTWRAFRCVLGESGKMGMIQFRQEAGPMTWRTALSFIPWTEPERKERSGYDRPIFCCGHVYDDQSGLAVGMMFAALFLLRPCWCGYSPGQRVALWVVGWDQPVQSELYGLLRAWSTSCPSPSVT